MSLTAEIIEAMAAAGITAEQIAAVAKTIETRRASLRSERNRRYYKTIKTNKTQQDAVDVLPPSPKERSPTPPKEITPSPPSLTELRSVRSGTPGLKTKIRSQISEDEQPVEADLEFARKAGMDSRRIGEEWAQFRDHHRKVGALFADWRAAWRTWVRNCVKFAPRLALTNGHDPPAKPRTAADRRESMLGWWQENGLTRAQAEEKWEKMPSLHG
jgi:hypothetical protein